MHTCIVCNVCGKVSIKATLTQPTQICVGYIMALRLTFQLCAGSEKYFCFL